MTRDEMKSLRKSLGLTQTEMAEQIGLTLRAYQALEKGETALRQANALAAERAALTEAIRQGNPMLAPASIRREALEIARLITGEGA
ncbi:helix-turn-helix domain-containing protein [Roseospira marina]|uniref:Helix-turn-helix domain-containing protein n=1 Tax=Roseospira marina TaxID=140057 RepID=A0A5M6I795_9PROT|nr:helix-turn-helix domain-containing protein [Roseospira marina]KAA5603972.1 helix-turn-helix domain-containing protein [Roseospira marina]MBB4315944.1 DNA-binding XRE family transcriptional regulator [Roseospira marina]MBB5089095.1 DNA-binding XRE family transcriptional regulator [Roseospira marina]